MAYARIVTKPRGNVIRSVNFKVSEGVTTAEVDGIASTLESIICEENDILTVEVDYTGCDDSDTVVRYDP